MSLRLFSRRAVAFFAVLVLIVVQYTPLALSQPNPPGPQNANSLAENGITVGKPKQFDERTLTAMLRDLENKLTRSQFPDPSGLYAATGRLAGATATTSSMAVSVRGPSTPSVVTTIGSTDKETSGSKATEGTEQTATIGGTNPSTTNKATSSNEATTSGESTNTNQQVTTQGSFVPPTATLPGQTSLLPFQPQFGLSAQDLLAEQTSLFYQIVNLRLLLDRSISDRLEIKSTGNGTSSVKRDQFVVGFQISIDAAHKDAVAEAEITVNGSELSLVSLMPQDKTYNVASVTKDSKAFDMGAVVQLIGVGAGFSKTQESVYLVKDTDTVALERRAGNGLIKFAWQFRPVLGRRTIEPGSRQVYALVSIPKDVSHNLTVTATTKWRRYDRKAKTVGALITGTERSQYSSAAPFVVGTNYATEFSLQPRITSMKWSDMGNGQVLVVVDGEGFTPDTTIVLGNTVLDGPDKGLNVANEQRLTVVTKGQLFAQSPSPPIIVARYGATDFVRGECFNQPDEPVATASTNYLPNLDPCRFFFVNNTPYDRLRLEPPSIKARDAQSFEVTVTLVGKTPGVDIQWLFERHKPVVVIGDKVFGLSDAPFIARNFKLTNGMPAVDLTFVAPAQVLMDSKTLVFKEFLWNKGSLTHELTLPSSFSATKVVTLGSNGERTQLAIAGGGFNKQVKVQVGETLFAVECTAEDTKSGCLNGSLTLKPNQESATVITLSPTKAQIKDVKQILVMQGAAQPKSLELATPPPTTPTAKIIAPKDLTLDQGDSTVVKFEGANFESIQKVLFENKELDSKPDPEDKAVRLVEISTVVTAHKGKKRIVFVMKDDKEVEFKFTVR